MTLLKSVTREEAIDMAVRNVCKNSAINPKNLIPFLGPTVVMWLVTEELRTNNTEGDGTESAALTALWEAPIQGH